MTLGYDSEFLAAVTALGALPKHGSLKTAYELREFNNPIIAALFSTVQRPDNIQENNYTLKSHDGADVQFTRFASTDVLGSSEPTPAVVYAHGGGMIAGSVDMYRNQLAALSHESSVPFFAVRYRLAPEYPAPTGVQDVFAVVKYVSTRATELNIDPARIAIYGDSAGGGVAVGTALLARDYGLTPPLAKQLLVYPMLDNRTDLKADDPLREFLAGWTPEDNIMAWDAYVGGDKRGKPDAEVSPYASPPRAASLQGLPSTYIDIGSLDLFRDESIAYAARLVKDGVKVELHLWPGLPHAFDAVPGVSWSTTAKHARRDAVKKI